MTKKNTSIPTVTENAVTFADSPTIENLRQVGDSICEQGSGYRLDQVAYTIEDMLKQLSDCGDRLTNGKVIKRIVQALQYEAIGKAIYREEQAKKDAETMTLAAALKVIENSKK